MKIRKLPGLIKICEIALTLVVFELASWLGLAVLHRLPERSFHAVYVDKMNEFENPLLNGFSQMIPHPFFGYQHDKEKFSYANNFGFGSDEDYPPLRKPGDYVIGILGGSVAEHFAMQAKDEHLLDRLSDEIPALRGKRIVVMNLALAGGKQPQQFTIASYFLPDLDFLINLDGFNDSWIDDQRFPAGYPLFYRTMYASGKPRPVEQLLIAGVENLRKLSTSVPLRFRALGVSHAYYLCWSLVIEGSGKFLDHIATRLLARTEKKHPFFDGREQVTDAKRVGELVSVWERFTRYEYDLAREDGKGMAFFIQPNQYVSPAKPFSAQERSIALSDPQLGDSQNGVAAHYRTLRASADALRALKLPIYDLTDVYKDVTGPIYIDNCCHMNSLGNRLMAKRMIALLKAHSGELGLRPRASRAGRK